MFVFIDEDDNDDDEIIDFSEPEENDSGLVFEEDIPPARSITDTDVQRKAKRGRKRRVTTGRYANKIAAGWSLYCAHSEHLPNLCERAQDNGEVTCSCECHEHREYVQQESSQLPGSNDEEVILLFD